MNKVYNAKSENQYHGIITNHEHCEKVSELSKQFGEEISMPDEAYITGLFHDFGKYGDTFQDVLDGTRHNIDHAFPGAAFLFMNRKLNGIIGSQKWIDFEPIIESIAGHHDGLFSMRLKENAMKETYESLSADCCPSGKFPSLRGKDEFTMAKRAFREEFKDFCFPKLNPRNFENKVEDMLDTRMLFSCLVDADYSISASDNDPNYLEKNSREPLDAGAALKALEAHREEIKQTSNADKSLNMIRDKVFESCGNAGKLPPGLYTITAPTGVGKTLAMVNFAIKHCMAYAMRRIIVVLPFLTLAEQTERVYRQIFPDILVDHSQSDLPDELRELAARWDAPVIITTSVRFFESLFSDQPTDCRKLHNIAGSVILFDESQSLPSELAPATIKAVNALCKKYKCSFVFSTATQPDFGALRNAEWKPTEIIPNSETLFEKMRRVKVEWRLFKNERIGENPTFADIAAEIAGYENVCVIVNLRRHARELFKNLKSLRGIDGLYLLTTDLCPAHRIEVVKEIKEHQALHKPCIVVATQCIEAGVDLDFDIMFRSLAPLESIIQAAGRCNRNQRLEFGKVIVFESDDVGRLYPEGSYERASMIVKTLWSNNPELDISNPALISEYYRLFFKGGKPCKKLDDAIEIKDYPNVSREYKLIKNTGVQLIVPWSGKLGIFNEIRNAEKIDRTLLHKAAPITVNCFEKDYVASIATPIMLGRPGDEHETGYYILNSGFYDRYDPLMGLKPEDTMCNCLMS